VVLLSAVEGKKKAMLEYEEEGFQKEETFFFVSSFIRNSLYCNM